MATTTTVSTAGEKKVALSADEQQKIVNGFQGLRDEQTQLVQKTQDLEMEMREHDLVLSTLSVIADKQRRCYRMIGGVLIEHTVGEVLPALQTNREQIHQLIETLNQKTEEKAKDLTAYKQKHDIRFSHERPQQQQKANGQPAATHSKKDAQESGVLVEKEL